MAETRSRGQDRLALVTGGAGGIGQRIVERLASDGYRVTVADIVGDDREAVARAHGAVAFVGGDLRDPAQAREAIEIASNRGQLSGLVNCVGISPKKDGRKRPLNEIELSEWNEVLAVNLTLPFLVIREAWDSLADDEAGIVNITSIAGKLGTSGPEDTTYGPQYPAGAHYAASKAALRNLTISVARELAPRGIRCNSVSPGHISGGMGGTTDPGLNRAIAAQVPLGHSGSPEDIAGAVSFLLSTDARYITGESLDVDGGWVPD